MAVGGTIAHCQRMYRETANPYYVVMALHAARWGDFTPPEWALAVLLKAVSDAARNHVNGGHRISIDDALGLTVTRGKVRPESSARRASVETSAFDLARTIHTCFDVSIPQACEIVYYAIDFDLAEFCEENAYRPLPADCPLPRGISRAQLSELDKQDRTAWEAEIDRRGFPVEVKTKVRAGNWWKVTRGDRLGYSLDQFIDRYYRVGTKRKRPPSTLSELGFEHLEGYRLLSIPDSCSHEITLGDANGDRTRCVSALVGLTKKPEFERFYQAFSAGRYNAVLK